MKKFYFLVMALFVLGLSTSAQNINGTVKGILQDSSSQALMDATVSVMRLQDSSLISFTVSDKNGSFEIKNIAAGNYNLIASFSGLKTVRKS